MTRDKVTAAVTAPSGLHARVVPYAAPARAADLSGLPVELHQWQIAELFAALRRALAE